MSARVVADGVHVRLGGRDVLRGLRAVAAPGEVTGVIGPNGSGKSTWLRTIYGHVRPDAGTVLIDGRDLATLSGAEAARTVAAVPQERDQAFDTTVEEAVALGRLPHQSAWRRASDADARAVAAALVAADLTGFERRRVSTLSGGERQRVLIARALAQEAGVLVLDEPTNHLDLASCGALLRVVRARRATVVLALHDLNLAAATCDWLHVVHGGRVVASGRPREVLTPRVIADVFGVRAAVVDHPFGGLLVAVDHS